MARRHPGSAVEIVDEDGFVQNPSHSVTAGFPSDRAAPVQGAPGALPIPIVGTGAILNVTLTLDTAIYADNDVLAAPQEIPNAFRVPGGRLSLVSVVLIDESDQGQDIDLVFMSAEGALGNENAAVGPTDDDVRKIIGIHSVLIAEYSDLGNSMVATKDNIGLYMQAAANSRSLWVGAIVRSGTPTYGASGIRLKLGVLWE